MSYLGLRLTRDIGKDAALLSVTGPPESVPGLGVLAAAFEEQVGVSDTFLN